MEGSEFGRLIGLKKAFRSGKTRGIDWRKAQLRALLKLIAENEAQIFEALDQDLGKHPVEAYRDEVCIFLQFVAYREQIFRVDSSISEFEYSINVK